MKKLALLFCLLAISLSSFAEINREFFGVQLGMTMSKVKEYVMKNYQAYDNEESISFPTSYGSYRVYTTMYFNKNVFYKIEITTDDSASKFRKFKAWNKQVINR